ncbi:MAG: phospholipase D/Transphosphatidylase [Herminiimonas sp.]|nr:phospholipase D/Transphosphatidylase [Herminiimonas sp.]
MALYGLALGLVLGLTAGCDSLPPLESRPASTADLNTGDTRLGRAIAPRVSAHPGASGIYSLPDARDAFAARALLAQAAERTLDVQYYIWHKDMTGTMLFAALRKAADRGVRVRLLLDDNNTSGLDPTLAALNAHPNIEIRLFNPFVIRRPRAIGYITDFSRANRRMHNKSFTADSQATIIGGRNVGDEYFGATDQVLFADLDVLAIGPVVQEVSVDFDRYWNSQSSYPVDRLLPPANPLVMEELSAAALEIERSPGAVAYTSALRSSSFVRDLLLGNLPLEWAPTRMVSDDPAKGLGAARPGALMRDKLRQIIGEPVAELDLVSPYFVPTSAGVDAFVALAAKGVKIKVLTNALEATDVPAVHAGYAKRRKPLLKAGVSLYELRRLSPITTIRMRAGRKGSSSSSLHGKTFSVDRSRVFIGSFNFDPRSAELNTEKGFIIDSPALAQRIGAVFESRIPQDAYEVQLSDTGQLYWVERRGRDVWRHDVEPGTCFWQRASVWFISMLPIEWLL